MTAPIASQKTRAESADVYKAGVLAARLRRRDDGVEFAYVDRYAGPPVATTLPVAAPPRVSPAGAVPPFFAGLLPEGRRLTALRQSIKASADDELSLLLAVGSDLVGDVVVVPTGAAVEPVEPGVTLDRDRSATRFADLLTGAGIVDGVGLPGVQDKVSAQVISMPVTAGAGRFILKLDPPEYPHVVVNEAYVARIARRCGLVVAPMRVVRDADDRPGLLVTRFDRIAVGGEVLSLGCEDACQLLDLWPADKYNTTTEDLVGAVSSTCAASVVAIRDVFRQLVFAWVIGNGDVHAKNISVLRAGDEWRVAPAYDLVSTVFYGDTTMALPMGDKVDGFARRQMLAFATNAGLAQGAAGKVIDRVLAGTAAVDDEIRGGALPFADRQVRDACRAIANRRRLLAA